MVLIEQRTGGTGLSGASVDTVAARMRALRTSLPPKDGLAVFNRVYLAVTEEIGRSLTRGAFDDSRAAATLDVLFAGRYLRAVDTVAAGLRPPACWRPLFQYRRHPGVRPSSSRSAASTPTSGTTWRSPSSTAAAPWSANRRALSGTSNGSATPWWRWRSGCARS